MEGHMKKLVVNFITMVLLILTSTKFVFAEKIVCKVEEGYYGIYVSLILCNDDNEELSDVEVINLNPDKLNDNQRRVLTLINGIEINDREEWYEQIMSLNDQLDNVKRDPLQPSYTQQIIFLHSEIFRILGIIIDKKYTLI